MGEGFTIQIPENVTISVLGFTTALADKAFSFTSEDVSITVNGKTADAKSILGLMSLNFRDARELKFQVIGEMAHYAVNNLERFVKKLVALYE